MITLTLTRRSVQHAYLIDVREPDEVIQGNIPSSVNLPLSVLSGSLQLPATQFHKKHGFSKPGLDQEIVFYCRSGKRSATASDVAKRNGYTKFVNVFICPSRQFLTAVIVSSTTRGLGWTGWKEKGSPLLD